MVRLKAAHVIRARQIAHKRGWTYLDPRPAGAPAPVLSPAVRLRLLAQESDRGRGWDVCEGTGQRALNVRTSRYHVRLVGDCPVCGHTAGVRTTDPHQTHTVLAAPIMRAHQHGGPKR